IIANNVHGSHGEAGINILHRAVALDALYDSADSFPQPRCHPETRTQMLDDLLEWAVQDKLSQPIRWLHGPAGAGKSAIMQTLCQKLQDVNRIGGAFFFKRAQPLEGTPKYYLRRLLISLHSILAT
ncbi:hypothetical protein B0H13DRAFT_1603825, partial [Mycena leptocephala]